jgi:c(7)-type cytochrome triheme protein
MRMTWRTGVGVAAVVVLVGLLGAVMVGEARAQAKGPADFEFAGGKEGKVAFSHSAHAAKSPKCTDCHTKIFKMTKGTRSTPKMADMEKGQSCGTCHNGQAAFGVKEQANCAKCHKK